MIWCKNIIWIDKIQSTWHFCTLHVHNSLHMYNTFLPITLSLFSNWTPSKHLNALRSKTWALNVLYNTVHIKSAVMYIKWLSTSGLSWLDFVQHMHSSFHSKKSISNNSSTKMHFRSEFPCESKSALTSSLNVSDVIR